jgi:hypothetical protein
MVTNWMNVPLRPPSVIVGRSEERCLPLEGLLGGLVSKPLSFQAWQNSMELC